jgi:hypothetical protein
MGNFIVFIEKKTIIYGGSEFQESVFVMNKDYLS